jgi:hypothetical protein
LRQRIATLLALSLVTPTWLFADFQYTESTKISGGSLMSMMKFAGSFSKQARHIGDPVISSVYVKGNRMARVASDHTEIVDLDRETITHIDHQKKQYYTITFQQMKEQLEAAQREAAQRQREHPQPEAKAEPVPNTTDMKFDVAVRNTGVQKEYRGLNTSESILTLTMQATDKSTGQSGNIAMTNDLWLTPEIPGYQEVREFNIRYARKLGDVYGSVAAPAVASMQSQMKPGSTQGMGEMAKEISKLKGVPIYTVMRMGSTTDGKPLPAASEAPLPASDQNADMPSKGDLAKQGANDAANNAANNAIASKLGGFGSMMGGFGHKKKDPPPPPPPADDAAAAQQQPTSMVLMETVSEMGGFSSAPVDPAHFRPPDGYQQVPIPTK